MPKDDDKGKEIDLTKQVAELTKLVGTLAGGFDAQKTAIESLTNNVSQLSNMNQEQLNAQQLARQQQVDDNKAAADAEDDTTFDANALESMNRSDFMDVILKQVNKGFKDLSGQITGQIEKVNEGVNSSGIQIEYDKVLAMNPDFNHYKEEIAAIAQKNPEMAIKDMYTLAKANNPEKVIEVTETLKKEEEKIETKKAEDAAEEIKTKSKSFGGLTPTSGQRQDKPSDMTQESAGNSAWEETMAEVALEQ